jgi:succinyl-CoA synthetase beta subunit/citryl-CoA synthetase large subunit
MTRLLEHQSLDLLIKAGVAVPSYFAVATPEAAADAARTIKGPVVIKALIPAGRRGKSGGVLTADSPAKAAELAGTLLGRTLGHFPVQQVLIQSRVQVSAEYFCAFTYDSMARGPVVLFSTSGGVDIEELFANQPEKIITRPVEARPDLLPFVACEIAESAGLQGEQLANTAATLCRLYDVLYKNDAALVEVNPLALDPTGNLVALSAVVNVDDQASFRHSEWDSVVDPALSNGWRPLTALERRMREIDAIDAGSSIRFNEFTEGRIACMLTGGGSGLLTLDQFHRMGEMPATTFDITPGRVEEKMYLATKAILAHPGLAGLIAGGNITNFIPIDVKVRGVVRALKELKTDAHRFPIVFRYAGPGVETARELAAEIPGIEFYDHRMSLEGAVERIVNRVREVTA